MSTVPSFIIAFCAIPNDRSNAETCRIIMSDTQHITSCNECATVRPQYGYYRNENNSQYTDVRQM